MLCLVEIIIIILMLDKNTKEHSSPPPQNVSEHFLKDPMSYSL